MTGRNTSRHDAALNSATAKRAGQENGELPNDPELAVADDAEAGFDPYNHTLPVVAERYRKD